VSEERPDQSLVGQRVKVLVTEHIYTATSGKQFPHKVITIDDPEMTARVKALGGRWKVPGWVYTQDYIRSRLNVRINEEGLITEVFYG
jgi:hypothetical protein